MRPPSAAQSRAGAVAPAPRGFPVVACPDSIARDTRCLLLTHTSITDPQGSRTGVTANGATLREIPRSAYFSDSIGDDSDPTNTHAAADSKHLEIIGPAFGTYALDVTGTGTGPYTIEF